MEIEDKLKIPYKGFTINLSLSEKYFIMYGSEYLSNYGDIMPYTGRHRPFYKEMDADTIFLYNDVPACQKWINWIIKNKAEILV